jgi:hypothetical protein
MGFLHPVFAVAAAAVAVPILLHLVRRKEVRRLTFPAIRYLRRAEQRHARRVRLRHLLLLAARALIVLLAAVAAAGPLIGRGGARDHRPTALAIVVDESQSSGQLSGDRRLLDLYAERVVRTLDLVTGDDRFALFSAAQPEEGALTTDVDGARAYVDEWQPTAGLARLNETVRLANAWLDSFGGMERELHILTDLQSVSLAATTSDTAAMPEKGAGVSVRVFSPRYEVQPNGALGNPVPEVQPLGAGLQTNISVTLTLYGAEPPAEPTVVRLVANDDVVGIAEGIFGGQTLLRLPPQDSGWVQGYLEAERSGLAADDRRYFTWFARPAPRVAVLGEATPFLMHSLDALERGGRLYRTELTDAEVWITDGGDSLGEGLASGRSVIVLPPVGSLDLPRLNLRLSRAEVPWQYDAREREPGMTRIGARATLPGLAGLAVHSHYRLLPSAFAPGDTALLRLADGQTWLVRGTTQEGAAYLLLASPLAPEASDLPVSAAMVPFVDALVGDWARRGAIEPVNVEGVSTIRLPARANAISQPGDVLTTVEGGAWFRATRAGNYRVLDGDRVLLAFSVNAPTSEADLSRARPGALESTLPAAEWSWSEDENADDWVDGAFQTRRGKLAWRPLVVFLLLVSIVEASLSAVGRRKAAQPGGIQRNSSKTIDSSGDNR